MGVGLGGSGIVDHMALLDKGVYKETEGDKNIIFIRETNI